MVQQVERRRSARGTSWDICTSADVSGGVDQELEDSRKKTLFVNVGSAVDITVKLSPDGGTTWYEIPESPLSYSSATDDVLEIGYAGNKIRLTGSNAATVSSQVYGVF